ncbi:MAG: hypothetical protein R3E32_09420 [Chitinophagales bacterium]
MNTLISIFEATEQTLLSQGFTIERKDSNRPWGGFFVIEEQQAAKFVETYFPEQSTNDLVDGRMVSPKILLVAPNKRLSWQYHHRRSEVWRVVEGRVGIVRSQTDEEQAVEYFEVGDVITLSQGERHRLVGLDDWGKIAEIWQHTDPNNPSNENDIVRLQDDFGRNTPEK